MSDFKKRLVANLATLKRRKSSSLTAENPPLSKVISGRCSDLCGVSTRTGNSTVSHSSVSRLSGKKRGSGRQKARGAGSAEGGCTPKQALACERGRWGWIYKRLRLRGVGKLLSRRFMNSVSQEKRSGTGSKRARSSTASWKHFLHLPSKADLRRRADWPGWCSLWLRTAAGYMESC